MRRRERSVALLLLFLAVVAFAQRPPKEAGTFRER